MPPGAKTSLRVRIIVGCDPGLTAESIRDLPCQARIAPVAEPPSVPILRGRMPAQLPVDAFLTAARRHRLLDSGAEGHLRESLYAAAPATPLEIDAWLAGNPILPTESIARLRRLLPNAQAYEDYKPHRPLAHLATGGMGEIWLAAESAGELVVIKTLRTDSSEAEQAIDVDEDGTVWIDTGSGGPGAETTPGSAMHKRIERESRITRQLHHPNIVHCRDHGITRGGSLFMVLEFHGSGDLFELISLHGRLGEALALSLVEQVAAALEASHRLHLVHRDIKRVSQHSCHQPQTGCI